MWTNGRVPERLSEPRLARRDGVSIRVRRARSRGTADPAVGGAIGRIFPGAPSVDVAAQFTKAMPDPFRRNASVTGEMTIESRVPVEGESTIDGPDNHSDRHVAILVAPERTRP